MKTMRSSISSPKFTLFYLRKIVSNDGRVIMITDPRMPLLVNEMETKNRKLSLKAEEKLY